MSDSCPSLCCSCNQNTTDEGIYIGIGNVFNPSQEDGPAAVKGQVNMVLGWSSDGRKWKWLVPNDSIIPLGKSGDFDACGVFGAKQDPLRTTVNDTLRMYYAGEGVSERVSK